MDREPSKMDRARESSRQRDLSKRKAPDDLSRDLVRQAQGPVRRPRKKSPLCPECKDSVSWMHWDGYRNYWIHERCGYILLPEDVVD